MKNKKERPILQLTDKGINILEEAKEDQQRLVNFAGNSLAKRFFELKNKNRLKSPENDIYYWLKKTPLELETRVTEIENTLSRSQERKISKLDGAELVAKNSDWEVYRIDTHNASCLYGKGTKWCTAGRDSTYFDSYKEQGIVLYYIISDNKKYAIALYPKIIDALQANGVKANFELFDEEDNAIRDNEKLEKILNKFPKIPNVELIFEFLPAEIKDNILIRVYPYNSGEFIIPDGVISIGNYAFRGCNSLTSIIIPDSVTSIGNNAFSYCSSLTNIIIPDSVTSIGNYAFGGCTSLTSITIPSSVTSIGGGAFSGCSSLTSITIPSSVTSIGNYSFYGCTSLTSITIPDSVTSIGSNAFYNCASLTSITIPDSVTSIGGGAFSGCSSLTSITIPLSVTSISDFAFSYCSSLTNIIIPDSVTSIGNYSFYECSSLTSIKIPDSVTSIGDRAFSYCSSLTNIIIPDSVTSIGNYAFYNCRSLTSITIPPSVRSIGSNAFYNCTSLTSITIPDSVTSIGDRAFYGCSSLTIYAEAESKPGGWHQGWNPGNRPIIWNYKENSNKRITENTLMKTILGVLNEAKEDQQKLVNFAGNSLAKRFFELKNKNRLKSPENDIYYWLKKTPLELEKRVTEIENTLSRAQERKISKLDGAELVAKNNEWEVYRIDTHNASCFYGKGTKWCTAGRDSTYFDSYKKQGIVLYYIISDNKKYAIALYPKIIDALQEEGVKANFELFDEEDNAIRDNKKLEKILNKFPKIPNVKLNFEFLPAEIKDNVLIRVYPYNSGEFIIPDSVTSISDYAFSDCTSLTSIIIPGSVRSIESNAFYNCTSLTSITIPGSVRSIESNAFYNCTSLTSITIPSSVTSIGDFAFYNCTSLTSITIPSSVTSIGDGAFYGCSSLTSITIPDSVTSIGKYAFYHCTSLTSIEIPDSVTSISDYTFGHCTNLTSIIIPDSVTSISDYAFARCINLTSIEIPDSVISIGKYAFWGCTSLTSIIIPDSVRSIGSSAFYDCTSLTSIEIPGSVTSIGSNAFFYCPNLTSIIIPDSVTSIGDRAFYGCSSLTSITIPDSVTSIGDYAFSYCTSLTSIEIPDSVTSIGNYAFSDCSRLTSITIPSSVTSIGSYVFYNCRRLTIYAEAESKPERWHQGWNPANRPIIWNYKENSSKRITENTLMETLLEVLNEAKEEVQVEEQQKETQLEKKYEITTEAFTNISGVTVYRIKSLKNFAGIQKGELGGYIESEDNLSHSGNCWVKDNAMVYSGGRVEQNALVSGISEVYNNALVTGQAKVDGNCYIYDNVKVGTDSTKDCTIIGGVNVYGGSEVKSGLLTGGALVYNNSIIYDKAQIKDYAIVSNSKVGGETIIYHNAKVTDVDANGFIDIAGNSILEGPISIRGKVQIYGTSRLKGSDEGITIDATKGEIHIKDNAEVQGSPTIKGHVIIEGNAKVSDKAFIGTSISDNGNLEVKGAILKRLQNTQDYITTGGYGGANYFDENIVITDNAVVQGQASIISGGVIYNKKKKKNREYKASDIVVKTHGAKVEGNAVVKGNAIVGPGVVVTNDAILDGNIYFVNSELVDKTPTYSGVDKVIDSTLSANQDTMNTKVKEDEEPIITSEELSKNENLQLIKELYFDNDKLKEYLPEEEYKDLQKLIIRDLYNKVKIDIRLIHDTLKILETSIWGMEINKFYNADNPEQLDQLIKEFYKLAPSLIIRLNKVAEIAKAAFDKLDSNKISKLDKDKKIDLFLYNRTLVDIIKLTKGLIN